MRRPEQAKNSIRSWLRVIGRSLLQIATPTVCKILRNPNRHLGNGRQQQARRLQAVQKDSRGELGLLQHDARVLEKELWKSNGFRSCGSFLRRLHFWQLCGQVPTACQEVASYFTHWGQVSRGKHTSARQEGHLARQTS
jgi:hypothetical protein